MLPDGTVLDGELLPWVGGRPLPFAQMQRRIGRKVLGKRILEEVPVILVAYDLLEEDGEDLRALPLNERRERLTVLLDRTSSAGRLTVSPPVFAEDWAAIADARLQARDRGAEGLMLKRLAGAYGVGRRKGEWWKWKVEPYRVDAVLMYAQAGSGRRAGLFTDYTFGVWDREALVPFAKAYSGLTDEEIRRVDAFVRRNTVDKHGPVRVVKPVQVFELAFEGIQAVDPPQVRRRRAVSPDAAVADRQAARGGGLARHGAGAAHSALIAVMGSVRTARSAGKKHPAAAIARQSPPTAASVAPSAGPTSASRADMPFAAA